MHKDVEALQSVSKYFTEDSLRKIVAKAEKKGEQEVEILSWSFGEASEKGDGYLSTIDRIVPAFEKFLKSKNQFSVLVLPDFLDYHLDGEEDFIVLKDATSLGFHAVSFAYKDQNREHFKILASSLSETYFREDLYESCYKRLHKRLLEIAQDALEKECSGSKAQKRFNSYTEGEFCKKSSSFIRDWHGETSVINHGDAWAPNFLVRTLPNGQIEVLMLDFQLARSASPILDLSFFMYSCTEKTLRDQHFDNWLKMYHDELSRVIALLGSDPQKVYSCATFMNEVQEKFVHGVTYSLESVTFSMLSSDETFDLDAMKDEKVDIVDVFTLKNIEKSEKRKRLTDVISHAVERGFL
uniref:CHK kinase-like domain-containing protein n=1 Tax=Trichogramma kaykai TaxID=54128 RepID=A0ABD2XMK2_9HYME